MKQNLRRILRDSLKGAALVAAAMMFSNCATDLDNHNEMIVSVRDQQLLLVHDGKPVKSYPVSTSKFGIGSANGSYKTPMGHMRVAKKIGDGQPPGMVFKSRRPTGEVLKPNAPGRDPVIGRILWLTGLEPHNRNTFSRTIYIHGTPEESRLGTPASYGCVRMAQRDVVDLYKRVGVGAKVRVIRGGLESTPPGRALAQKQKKSRTMIGMN